MDRTPVVGTQRLGWLLAAQARLVFCVPSHIEPSAARPLNGILGLAVRLTNRRREAVTSRFHPRHVRIDLSTGAGPGDVHGLARWLAQVAAGRRLAGGTFDARTRDALAALAAGAPAPVQEDADGGTTVSYALPGAAVVLGAPAPGHHT